MISKTKQNLIAVIGILSLVGGCGAIGATGQFNSAINNSDSVNSTPQTETVAPIEAQPKVETRIETTEHKIPFRTFTTQDASLEKGKTRVISEGQDGTETTTYKVTYIDGLETERLAIGVEVTQAPVDRVIAEGTYVAPAPAYASCQNGSYVNSAGQTVCRPSAANTGGATAICRDGTHSYSHSRRGTCSHHGGVSKWL